MEVSTKSRSSQLIEGSMDINNLMKQAQQMQEKMAKMQEKASNAEVTGF